MESTTNMKKKYNFSILFGRINVSGGHTERFLILDHFLGVSVAGVRAEIFYIFVYVWIWSKRTRFTYRLSNFSVSLYGLILFETFGCFG